MRKTPGWAWALMIALGLVEPILHLWLRYGLPDTVAFTGLHMGDDSSILVCMNLFPSHFFSPFATCLHAAGPHDPALFSQALCWFYAVLGWFGAVLGLNLFVYLGFLNGLGGLFMAWAVYRFLCTAASRQANRAFAIYMIGGGLGGLLYLLTGALGLHGAAGFEAAFHRFAQYDLVEGAYLSPWLLLQRLYYTAPLGLGFLVLEREARRDTTPRIGSVPVAGMTAMLVLSAVNVRLGPLFWFALACLLVTRDDEPLRARLARWLLYALPLCAAVGLTAWMTCLNPEATRSQIAMLRRSIGLGSFISASFWCLAAAGPAIAPGWRELPGYARVVVGAGLGYLACFTALYVAYQTYYGNWLAHGDASAAIAVSDWSLLGAALGAGYGIMRAGRGDRTDAASRPAAWALLWATGLVALGVSAWGRGWFVRLMPERCMVLASVPLSVLAACGLERVALHRPRFARVLLGVLLVCGACSVMVHVLVFLAPIGHTPFTKPPFQWALNELMTPAEAEVIHEIDAGVVLAPPRPAPLYGDIVVVNRPGVRTVFGQASLGCGDVFAPDMAAAIRAWFSPEATLSERRAFVEKYCVDHVLCPEAYPVSAAVLAQLRATPWLRERKSAGDAHLLEVME